jgi:hypothetical protein
MKITKHITFYYLEKRIYCLNKIIDETNNYKFITDIFIHTNNYNFTTEFLNKYTNGSINIIYHDLTDINPSYLTWKCRDLLYKQKNDYDIFIYIEDDILVPFKAIEYWLYYNEYLINMNYNLGFVRIEFDVNNQEYITDLYGQKLDKIIDINNKNFCINDKNPYCAFWIYNKNEFNKFVNSSYYDMNNILNYGICEKSAIGLHGLDCNWYKATVIPIINNTLIESCKIYHIPNNYITNNNNLFATIKFSDAIHF